MLRASYRAPLLHHHQLQISKRHLSGTLVGALIHSARPRATPPLLLLLPTSLTSWDFLDRVQKILVALALLVAQLKAKQYNKNLFLVYMYIKSLA